ncbi:SHOCT domain-containing protein [Opitutus sp. ER46]|uniref:SHOCT domain-containing protein n=1 Tax=Opitutus sp. ER46 TaxID=2161864 RepID=UPI001304B263|nr:SHOCT domain-containing protein [Opitutus sp. ER46]
MITHSETGFQYGAKMKAAALNDARAWCERHGKVMKMISATQKDVVVGRSCAYAEVHFKALAPDDPEAQAISSGDLKGTGTVARDRYTELARLGELRNTGLITEEEFQTEKKRLLGTKSVPEFPRPL